MAMPETIRWTRNQVLALPADGKRYELVDGQLLVSPAPSIRHQVVLGRLFAALNSFVTEAGLGVVLWSPADLELEPGQLSQPDLFVLPGLPPSQRWEDAALPRLVIEALSPSTARHDRGMKRRFYQRAGVPEYWVVDIDARVIERWRPADERPEVADTELSWSPHDGSPALVLEVAALFP